MAHPKKEDKISTSTDLPVGPINPADLKLPEGSTPEDEENWRAKVVADFELAVKKAAGFSLDPYFLKLYMEEPFFASILQHVNRIPTLQIPTAGVMVHDTDLILLWNPIFFSQLGITQVCSIIKHECYHLVLQHVASRRQQPHKIWNYATDLAINCLIASKDDVDRGISLTKECLYPGRELYMEPEKRALLAKKDPKALADFDLISKTIASFDPLKASEHYFRMLNDAQDGKVAEAIERQSGKKSKKKGKGAPGAAGNPGDSGDPTDGQGEGEGEGDQDGDGDLDPQIDSHDGWDEMTEEQREMMRAKLGQILSEAINRCDASNNWGSIPNDMRAVLRELVSNKVDWRALLRYFVGTTRRATRRTSMKKINRKYPWIHPGIKRGYSARINIYIDNSGSVGDEDIALFFGELNQLSKHVDFDVFFFDTEVHSKEVIRWRKGQKVKPIRVKCGGTDFNAPTRHGNGIKGPERPDSIILLTDGECSKPIPSKIKRAFIICPNRKLAFAADPQDIVLEMDNPKLMQ